MTSLPPMPTMIYPVRVGLGDGATTSTGPAARPRRSWHLHAPSPGSWRLGVKIARVIHAFDLPGTDDESSCSAPVPATASRGPTPASSSATATTGTPASTRRSRRRSTGSATRPSICTTETCWSPVAPGIYGYPAPQRRHRLGPPRATRTHPTPARSPGSGTSSRPGTRVCWRTTSGVSTSTGEFTAAPPVPAWEYLPKGQTQVDPALLDVPHAVLLRHPPDRARSRGVHRRHQLAPSSTRSPGAGQPHETGKRTVHPRAAAAGVAQVGGLRAPLPGPGAEGPRHRRRDPSSGAGIREVDLIDYARCGRSACRRSCPGPRCPRDSRWCSPHCCPTVSCSRPAGRRSMASRTDRTLGCDLRPGG